MSHNCGHCESAECTQWKQCGLSSPCHGERLGCRGNAGKLTKDSPGPRAQPNTQSHHRGQKSRWVEAAGTPMTAMTVMITINYGHSALLSSRAHPGQRSDGESDIVPALEAGSSLIAIGRSCPLCIMRESPDAQRVAIYAGGQGAAGLQVRLHDFWLCDLGKYLDRKSVV